MDTWPGSLRRLAIRRTRFSKRTCSSKSCCAPTPYHFCLSATLVQINAISKQFWNSDPVAFVFANQPEYQDYAKSIHEVFAQNKRFRAVGSLTFAEPRCVIPLQAADLYSYENYRHILANIENPENSGEPTRAQLKIIADQLGQKSQYAPLEMLHHMADEFDKLPTLSA